MEHRAYMGTNNLNWFSDQMGENLTRVANLNWNGITSQVPGNLDGIAKTFDEHVVKNILPHAIAQTAQTNKFMLAVLRRSKVFKEVTNYYNANSGNFVYVFEYIKKNKVKQKENS